MKLFHVYDPTHNLLPYQGTVNYYGPVIQDPYALFDSLLQEVNWKHDQVKIFGKEITTKRKVAWYGDASFNYSYSGTRKTALPWTKTLSILKKTIEDISQETYNSCLLNLYHDGNEGMTWHHDAEKELQKHGAIASLSLGAERKFSFKHKVNKEKIDIILENGSLLVMKGETQEHWLHCLPKSKKITTPRINLTFRTIIS